MAISKDAIESLRKSGYSADRVRKALFSRDNGYAFHVLITYFNDLTLKEKIRCANIIATNSYFAQRLIEESKGKYDSLMTSKLWAKHFKLIKLKDYKAHINFGVKNFKSKLNSELMELDSFSEEAMRKIIENNYKIIGDDIMKSLNERIIKEIVE